MSNHLTYLSALDHAADLRARAERHRVAHHTRSVAPAADTRSVQSDRGAFGQRVCTSPEEFAPERSDLEADTRIGWVSSNPLGTATEGLPLRCCEKRRPPCNGIPGSEPQGEVGPLMASVAVRAEVASGQPPPGPHRRPVTVSDHDRRRGWRGDRLSQIPTTRYGLVNTGVVTLWNTLWLIVAVACPPVPSQTP